MGKKGGSSTFDIEIEALSDLVQRMRQLRRRVILPFGAVMLVFGHLGAAAHLFGYWTVTGIVYDDHYPVNFLTIAIAFILPICPILPLAFFTYRGKRAKMRKEWSHLYLSRGLTSEWLNSTAERFS